MLGENWDILFLVFLSLSEPKSLDIKIGLSDLPAIRKESREVTEGESLPFLWKQREGEVTPFSNSRVLLSPMLFNFIIIKNNNTPYLLYGKCCYRQLISTILMCKTSWFDPYFYSYLADEYADITKFYSMSKPMSCIIR